MNIEKITDLTPDPLNANKGTEEGFEMLSNSIEELGAGRSIVCDRNGVIIGGNKTWATASKQNMEIVPVKTSGDRLVVVVREDLDLSTDEKAKRLAIADNRVSQISLAWDSSALAQIGQDIDLTEFFNEEELEGILSGFDVNEKTEEELEEVPVVDETIESRVKPGEVWALGEHLVYCGDCLGKDAIHLLLNGRSPDIVWADPPYGIAIQDKNGKVESRGKKHLIIANDDNKDVAIASLNLLTQLFPKAFHVWWGANHYGVPPSPCWIVWDKKTEKGDCEGIQFADAELAWTNLPYAVRVFRHLWLGAWRESEVNESRVHPTQKPVALASWFYEKYGQAGNLIFDPFLGSGMSIIAAIKSGGDRRVVGCEIMPEYCEVIIQRWEKLTGKTASLHQILSD